MPNSAEHPCADCNSTLSNRPVCPILHRDIYLCQCRHIQQTPIPAVFSLLAEILNRKEIR